MRPIESLHAAREIGVRSFKGDVIVVCHQRVREDPPAKPLCILGKCVQEFLPVCIIPENMLALISTSVHMPQCSRILETKWS